MIEIVFSNYSVNYISPQFLVPALWLDADFPMLSQASEFEACVEQMVGVKCFDWNGENNVSKNSNKKSAMPKIAKSLFVFQVLAINEYVTMNKITTTILKPHDIIGTATGWKSARKWAIWKWNGANWKIMQGHKCWIPRQIFGLFCRQYLIVCIILRHVTVTAPREWFTTWTRQFITAWWHTSLMTTINFTQCPTSNFHFFSMLCI